MNRTGIVRSDLFLEHDPGEWHPESPKRLEAIHELLDKSDITGLKVIDPRPATREEITLIHTPAHYDRIEKTKGKAQSYLDADTQTSARSFEAALAAAGGLIDLVDKVIKGELDNGFALVRPPGHHAEPHTPMGFCLFNNIAVAAAWALQEHDLSRIMIIDWDLHHGNGTQSAFYTDPDVLYVSTHLFPFYPGSGSLSEIGIDRGKGYTINVPMKPMHNDDDYTAIFQQIVNPLIHCYKPELILVSAGFDIHKSDPMQGMALTPAGFAAMTHILKKAAEEVCGGKLVFTLEGGYDFIGEAISVEKMLQILSGNTNNGSQLAATQPQGPSVINQVRKVHSPLWNFGN